MCTSFGEQCFMCTSFGEECLLHEISDYRYYYIIIGIIILLISDYRYYSVMVTLSFNAKMDSADFGV